MSDVDAGYTASDAIETLKLKAWTSTSSALTDPQILGLLNDSLRSYLLPFFKSVRDEWFVSGSESVTPDSDGRITIPNSFASTIRRIWWHNNGQPVPLVRIEPEAAFAYEGNNGSAVPVGYMLRGYGLQILPANVGSVSIRLEFMERPALMVLEEQAGLIDSHASLALTLADVPLAWQEETPTAVDLISNVSPFSAVATNVTVLSLVGDVLTLSGIDASLVEDGFWVADVGRSPYPNVPIEFHPLLQLDTMCTIWRGVGDKRLKDAKDDKRMMAAELRSAMAPRTQGSAKPLINAVAPGMRSGLWWNGYGRG